MGIELLNILFEIAFTSVLIKYPNEVNDISKRQIVFNVIEQITEELANKHMELFVKDQIKDFVTVEQILHCK